MANHPKMSLSSLSNGRELSIAYHNLFDYPLNDTELKRWKLILKVSTAKIKIENLDNYYFLKGRMEIVGLRKERESNFSNKIKIAKNAAKVLKNIPTIMFVGVTGSL